jgi:hypothetical protein
MFLISLFQRTFSLVSCTISMQPDSNYNSSYTSTDTCYPDSNIPPFLFSSVCCNKRRFGNSSVNLHIKCLTRHYKMLYLKRHMALRPSATYVLTCSATLWSEHCTLSNQIVFIRANQALGPPQLSRPSNIHLIH